MKFTKQLLSSIIVFTLLVLNTTAQEFKTPRELADPDGLFADVNGVSVYYRALGNIDDPAVILIHGFGGSTFTWRDTLPALADAGYYAVALDLPPFGLSDKNPDLPYARSWMADLVADFMTTLDIQTATIVGHSMGGGVTAQFAVRHPAMTSALVFVSGGVFEALPTQDGQESASSSPFAILNTIDPKSPVAPILLRSLITRDTFISLLRGAYGRQEVITPDVEEGYARLLLIEDAPIGFLAYTQAQETDPISLDNLVQAVSVPVLLVWGAEDNWVSPELGKTMHAALVGSTLLTYAGVGHLPMEETPDQFNTDLIAFLNAP